MLDYTEIKKLADDDLTDEEIGKKFNVKGTEIAKFLKQNGYKKDFTFQDMVRLNQNGFSISAIADRAGRHRQSVHFEFNSRYQPIIKYKYRSTKPIPVTDEQLLEDYKDLSMTELADKHKTSLTKIQRRLSLLKADTSIHFSRIRNNGKRKNLPSADNSIN